MRGKMKAALSMALAVTMVMGMSTVAFADSESTVSVRQDNITVTKSAQWTTVDGKNQDENGNPYAKINFKVDTTQATTEVTNTVSKGGATDVMLVLDNSGSMAGNKLTKAKAAACTFADEVMSITANEVKLGLVNFETNAKLCSTLGSNKDTVKNAINGLRDGGGTNMSEGIKIATNEFSKSSAPNKLMIVLGDGYPNSSSATKSAATAAKNAGIKIVTIGYECNENLLKEIASDGGAGKMYYKAAATATNVVKDLGSTFVEISEQVTSTVVGNSLVDKIPAEFDVVEGTTTSNDTNVVPTLSADKKTVTWSWGTNKLEKKVYEMSVVVKLDMSKVPADYITNKSEIYTNGSTIKTDVDSTGSSMFGYGQTGVINLKSPKLSLADKDKVGVKEEGKLTGEGTEGKVDDSPKTADGFNPVAIAVLAGAALVLVGSGVALKKKASR